MTPIRWAPDDRSTVASRGLHLEVCDWGDLDAADIVVVATHGYLDCAAFFAPLASDLELLGPGVAVRALSFAGHGRSTWAGAYGWTDHTCDLLAVLAATRRRVPRARLCLVGHSFGGIQACHAALQPGAADLLVNIDAVGPPARPRPSGVADVVRVAAGQLRSLPVYPDVAQLAARRARSNPRLPTELLVRLAEELGRQTGDGSWTWRVDPLLTGWVQPWDIAPGADGDPLVAMGRFAGPALVLTGAADDHPLIRGPYPGDEALASVPGVTHVRVPHAGHYVHLEQRATVAAAIHDFLDRHA